MLLEGAGVTIHSGGKVGLVGRMVMAGTHMQPGETISTGSFFARIEACTFRDEAMLQLIPARL